MADLTQARLREVLNYDPVKGLFCWIARPSIRIKVGAEAGWLHSNGYVIITLDGKDYRAHRLAVFYMTGEWPPHDVDHIDRVRTNNKWENLRLATRTQNNGNSARRKNNTSGFTGVVWHAQSKKWHAQIKRNYKNISLGMYETKEAASAAYQAAAVEFYGEFARQHEE